MPESLVVLLSFVAVVLAVGGIVAVSYYSHRFWRWVYRGLRENMRHGNPRL
jgi:uncharacterized membrane protein